MTLIGSLPVLAEDPGNPDSSPRIISLEECLQTAAVKNIGLQRTRLFITTSILSRLRQESVFDPGFEADFSGKGVPSDKSNQFDLGLSCQLPNYYGGAWIFSLSQSRGHGTTGLTEEPITSYNSKASLTYSMSLLEGSEERINRMGIDKADLDIAKSEASLNEAARSLRFSIISAYINCALTAKNIEVAKLSLQTAQNLVDRTQAFLDVGSVAPYELLSAQAGLAERQENLLNTQSAHAIALDNLKNLVGLDLGENIEIDSSILKPIKFEAKLDDYLAIAEQNRADLKEIDLRIRSAELDILLADDSVKPSLSLNNTFSYSGTAFGYGKSISGLSDFTWYSGLAFKLPLGGNRAAVSGLKTAKISLEGINLERDDFLRNLETDLRSDIENLNNALQRIEVATKGLEVQKMKLQDEQKRLELGLITSRDLLEFDLDLANAGYALDSAMADALLAVSKLEFLTNKGLLADVLAYTDLLNPASSGNNE